MLAEYGMSVTDVSLDALATKNARIGYVELEHTNGTTITIDDLSLPIGRSSAGSKSYSAAKIGIVLPEEAGSEPLALAQLIMQILSLPLALENTEVDVKELSASPYPTIKGLRWASSDSSQSLNLSMYQLDLSMSVVATDELSHEVMASMHNRSGDVVDQLISLVVAPDETGVNMSGKSTVDMAAMAAVTGLLSASSGTASLVFDGHVPHDAGADALFNAVITPTAPIELEVAITPDDLAAVSVRSASPIKLVAMYPENQLSINGRELDLLVSYRQWNDMTVAISEFECSIEPTCFVTMRLAMDNADLTIATATRLELESSQEIIFREDATELQIRPDATLSLSALDASGTDIAGVNARLMSASTIELSDSGWQLTAESVDVDLQSLSLDEDLGFSAPISIAKLFATDTNGIISLSSTVDASYSELYIDERVIAFPGFKGLISLQGDDIQTELTTFGLYSEGSIQAQHDLGKDIGRFVIQDATISFDVLNLSERVTPWTSELDITAGALSFDLQFTWEQAQDGWQLDGIALVELDNLAGAYDDMAFADLRTKLDSRYQSSSGFSVAPSQIEIGLVEVGLPIENISADFVLDPDGLSAEIENLAMNAFGGTIKADPFHYVLGNERNTLMLRAESVELTELLTLKEFEAIDLTGSIAAELPLIIEGTKISIQDGTLSGETPGGVIRYQPGIVPDESGTSAMGIVTDALSNFEYDTLTSSVGYSKDGDLKLQMQISGRNPDMEDNRPVVLNLGVENNIPQMLKSLQAARAVEEILEKHITK